MFSVGVTSRGLGAAIAAIGKIPERMRREQRIEMGRVVHAVERDLKRVGLTGKKGWHPLFGVTGAEGSTLGSRTGRTRNTIVARVIDAPGAIIGVIGSPERHARIQEEGGTIHGRPYLRIPTIHSQTASGMDRMVGRRLVNPRRIGPMERGERSISRTFVIKSRAGNLWIVQRNLDVLTPLYLLKRSVTLRPRKMFATTLVRNHAFITQSFRNVAARVARGI